MNRHILLIDDDDINNLINTKIIKMNYDLTVSAYTNAKIALSQLSQWIENSPDQFPHSVFLDINMPIMDGWEFLDEFQKFPIEVVSSCKVYMLTSSIDIDDIEKAKSYNAVCDFISKPLTAEKLTRLAIAN